MVIYYHSSYRNKTNFLCAELTPLLTLLPVSFAWALNTHCAGFRGQYIQPSFSSDSHQTLN